MRELEAGGRIDSEASGVNFAAPIAVVFAQADLFVAEFNWIDWLSEGRLQ
ncbi:hypothetical protein [Nonomuraea sp. NPDC050202]